MERHTWADFWHKLLIHQWRVYNFPVVGWFVHGGGMVAHYTGKDRHIHMGLFCDKCGRVFDKDKPKPIGNLGESLVEAHMVENLCRRMVAHHQGLPWPPTAQLNEEALYLCMRRNQPFDKA